MEKNPNSFSQWFPKLEEGNLRLQKQDLNFPDLGGLTFQKLYNGLGSPMIVG